MDDDAATIIRILLTDPTIATADLRPTLDDLRTAIADSMIADLRTTISDLIHIASDHDALHHFTARETLTHAALELSLCPMHLIDYAICFDDDDADCAAIRMIHPIHDS